MTLASNLLLLALPALISQFASLNRKQDYEKSLQEQEQTFGLPVEEVFDFIIVGGGTAGCVLARRLSDANHSVLLLEAGGTPPPIQHVPLISSFTNNHPDISFNYQSTKQKNVALAQGGIVKLTSGKMLGGSSTNSDMIYERGHPTGFDEWAELTQDDSWKYENILQFYKKAEDHMGNFSNANDQHGVGGPMAVSRPKFAPGREVWLEAGREQGFNITDPNGPQTIGFAPEEFNTKNGRRVDTYNAYIKPVENTQSNLTVKRYAVVEEILFDKPSNMKPKATHVLYKRHEIKRVAKARKEIILSAGSYISPILLIKSGIGPKQELLKANKYSSKVRIANGVGQNLMNHPYLQIGPIYVNDSSKVWRVEENLDFKDFTVFLKEDGLGPLVNSYHVGTMEAFMESKRSKKETANGRRSRPDLQIVYAYSGPERSSVDCYIVLTQPKSRGMLQLNRSATGMEDDYLPIIRPNFYSKESDFKAIIDGIRFAVNTVEKTNAFKKIGAKFSKKPIKGCERKKFRSDEYWKCYIRQKGYANHHTSGTCKMGLENDRKAVVDSKLRVIGVANLRVVDASIMPRIPNTHIAAPVVMIAEKAAHDIIQEYKTKR